MTARSLGERLHARRRAELMPALRELLWLREGARLLDVGGGTGFVAEMIGVKGEVVVVEPNARKVARGRARRPRLKFVEAGAEQLPFPEFHFDAAMALMTLHHWADPSAGLTEVHRVLQPGGRLVLYEMPPSRAGLLRWMPHTCTCSSPRRSRRCCTRRASGRSSSATRHAATSRSPCASEAA